ncbi:MAG: tautomerase family protein [Desulfuromonadaceae bacterium]
MPILTLEGPPITDLNIRRTLVAELTEAAAKAYAMPKEKIILLLHENKPEEVAVGGVLISDRR